MLALRSASAFRRDEIPLSRELGLLPPPFRGRGGEGTRCEWSRFSTDPHPRPLPTRGRGVRELCVNSPMCALKHRTVGGDRDRRRPVRRAQRPRDLASRAPGAALQQVRQLERVAEPELRAHQRQQLVHQRHRQARAIRRSISEIDLVRAPPDRSAARGRITPRSISRPPLRYSGSAVSSSSLDHLETGGLERFEQRIGRAIATACGTARCRRSRRPYAPPDGGRRRRSGYRRASARTARSTTGSSSSVGEDIGRNARVCRAPGHDRPDGRAARDARPNRSGRAASAAPRRRSSAARCSSPISGLSAVDLKVARQRCRLDPSQRLAVDAPRHDAGSDENAPARNIVKARDGKPLGAREASARSARRDNASRRRRRRRATRSRSRGRWRRALAPSGSAGTLRSKFLPAVDAAHRRNGASDCDRGCAGRDRRRASPRDSVGDRIQPAWRRA